MSSMKCSRSDRSAQSTAPVSRRLSGLGSIRSSKACRSEFVISLSDAGNSPLRSLPSRNRSPRGRPIVIRCSVMTARVCCRAMAMSMLVAASNGVSLLSSRLKNSRNRTSHPRAGKIALIRQRLNCLGSTRRASSAYAISGCKRVCSCNPISMLANNRSSARVLASLSKYD
jgi:hypothetical protein